MDDVPSSMGTSAWTHVDACWVPRSKKNYKKKEKASYQELTSPRSLRISDAKECVQATQVVLDLEIGMQAMETKTSQDTIQECHLQEATHSFRAEGEKRKKKNAFHSSVQHSVPQPRARILWSSSVSHVAAITYVLCNWTRGTLV